MRFTSVVALFCALQTIVSALPLGPLSDEAIPREYELEMDYRSLSEPSLYRRAKAIPHQVDLHRSNMGTEQEHWALHVRPQDGHSGDLHTLDAVSDKNHNGVLQPDKKNRGEYSKPAPKAGSTDVHIANFASKSKAMDAINSVHANVKLTKQYPNHNCVDFTCHAVTHMAEKGHISQDSAQAYHNYANQHKDAVRTKTDTANNRKKAGASRR